MSIERKPSDVIGVHRNPVWRDRTDFIISTFVEEDGDRNIWEQLWTHQTGEYRFSLCCIPFFAYDLALDDEVETDSEYIITRVVKPSGHWTFRISFDDPRPDNIVSDVIQACDLLKIYYEWAHKNLLAISAPNPVLGQQAADYLWDLEQKGALVYETGRTHD